MFEVESLGVTQWWCILGVVRVVLAQLGQREVSDQWILHQASRLLLQLPRNQVPESLKWGLSVRCTNTQHRHSSDSVRGRKRASTAPGAQGSVFRWLEITVGKTYAQLSQGEQYFHARMFQGYFPFHCQDTVDKIAQYIALGIIWCYIVWCEELRKGVDWGWVIITLFLFYYKMHLETGMSINVWCHKKLMVMQL